MISLMSFHFVLKALFLKTGKCQASEECIHFLECPHTKKLYDEIKTTLNQTRKNEAKQELRSRFCSTVKEGKVCCEKGIYD